MNRASDVYDAYLRFRNKFPVNIVLTAANSDARLGAALCSHAGNTEHPLRTAWSVETLKYIFSYGISKVTGKE